MRKIFDTLCAVVAAASLIIGCCGCSKAAKKARYLEQAGRDFSAGSYDKAEIEYLSVLQLDVKDGLASTRLGTIYTQQGRLGRAIPYLLKARELQPEDVDVRLKLSRALLATGKSKEAREEANYVIDHWPENPEAPLLLVEVATTPKGLEETRQRLLGLSPSMLSSAPVLVALGSLELRQHHLKPAEEYLKKAQTLEPKSPSLNAALGTFYWVQRDFVHAEESFVTAADASPDRSPLKLLLVQYKMQNGDLVGARKVLELVTQKAPDFLPAWSLLGEIAATENRYNDCDAVVAKILARDPSNPDALLLSGRMKLARGDITKAIADFERMLKMYPQVYQLHYQLGVAYLSSGDSGGAIASLTRAISIAPNSTEAVVLLAGINIKKGDFSSAISSLKQLVEQRPDLAQPRMLLANAYRSQGNLTDALATYRQLEKLFPGNPQTSWLTGLALVQLNEKAQARQMFEHALELKSDYLPAVEQLVTLDLTEKQYAAARQRLDPQITRNPNVAGLYLLLAQVCLTQKQIEEAEGALKKTIQLDPSSATAYLTLAKLYITENKQQNALASLQEVVTKNPKEIAAWMLMAVIYEQGKNYQAAQTTYEKLLAINPAFSPALNNLAYLDSEQMGQLDKAHEYAKKAHELLPNEPNTADTLGWILFKKHQYSWALPLLQESARSLPSNPEIQFHLGMTYYFIGQTTSASQLLQRALSLSGIFAGSDEAKQMLSILEIDPMKAGAEVRALLEKRASEHPDDSVAISRLADLYFRNGEVDRASETYDLALRASPSNAALLATMANFNDRRQNEPKAYELAKAARKLAPDDPEVAHTLGRIAFRSGDHQWAVSLLQESISKEPEAPETLYDLAEAMYSVGRTTDAQSLMERALQKGSALSRSEEAQRFLDLNAFTTRPSEALAAKAKIDQALKATPLYLPALAAKAAALDATAEDNNAQTAYEEILKVYPDFSPAKKRLAMLYANNPSDLPKAYSLAMKARADLPDDAELSKTLGIILYRQNDFSKAANLLKESAGKRENDAELLYYLGMARYRLKDKDASADALQKALRLNLKEDLAAEARKALAELK